MHVQRLATPALVVDDSAFLRNVHTMGNRWPGGSLRPHAKAFKSTALARRLADAGHSTFCCATIAEIEGLAAAGLGDDLLLANEVVDATRLGALVAGGVARVTVAVDSPATIEAAVRGGISEVLIDVSVGMPRCGCEPEHAGALADRARRAGLHVRGVMGYEGHVVGVESRTERQDGTTSAMALLIAAHVDVGGDIVSGGGTGTWDTNTWVTELQAGSFTLMDTAYDKLDLPFELALTVIGTIVSLNPKTGFAVADVGLKSLGMDHGNPRIDGATVWFCSDEHITFGPEPGTSFADWHLEVGDRVRVWPAHIDPTVALHERMHIVAVAPSAGTTAKAGPSLDWDAEVIDVWPVDLRNW